MKPRIDSEALRNLIVNGGLSFKESSSSFIFTCPRCKKDKKLYIHKKTGAFICFRCADDGFKGNKPEYALAEIFSAPLVEIKDKLYQIEEHRHSTSVSFNFTDFDSDDALINNILPVVDWNPTFISAHGWGFEPAEQYLHKRGLGIQHIETYDIKFNPVWNTVVFPVKYMGDLYGWQERGIYNNFRYTLKDFKKDKMLMFQDRLINAPQAILTEGPVDALKFNLVPGGGNVCAMGKIVSERQLDIIQEHTNKLYVGLDPDASTEIENICRKMSASMEVYLLEVPKGKKDFGECSEEEALEQFHKAKQYSGQVLFYFKGM